MPIIYIEGLSAGGDLSANQFFAVRVVTNPFRVAAITVNTQRPIGILQGDPNAAGQPAPVAGPGSTCKARLGGTVTLGDTLSTDATGKLVTITPGTDTTRYEVAMALQSGVLDDTIFVLVLNAGRSA